MRSVQSHTYSRRAFVRLLGSGMVLVSIRPKDAISADFVLVISSSFPVESISASDLKKVLHAHTGSWPDGSKATIVLPPRGSPEMTWLSEQVLGMSEKAYRRGLLEKALRGALDNLVEASSVDQAKDQVAQTVGAITALPVEYPKDSVKVLTVL